MPTGIARAPSRGRHCLTGYTARIDPAVPRFCRRWFRYATYRFAFLGLPPHHPTCHLGAASWRPSRRSGSAFAPRRGRAASGGCSLRHRRTCDGCHCRSWPLRCSNGCPTHRGVDLPLRPPTCSTNSCCCADRARRPAFSPSAGSSRAWSGRSAVPRRARRGRQRRRSTHSSGTCLCPSPAVPRRHRCCFTPQFCCGGCIQWPRRYLANCCRPVPLGVLARRGLCCTTRDLAVPGSATAAAPRRSRLNSNPSVDRSRATAYLVSCSTCWFATTSLLASGISTPIVACLRAASTTVFEVGLPSFYHPRSWTARPWLSWWWGGRRSGCGYRHGGRHCMLIGLSGVSATVPQGCCHCSAAFGCCTRPARQPQPQRVLPVHQQQCSTALVAVPRCKAPRVPLSPPHSTAHECERRACSRGTATRAARRSASLPPGGGGTPDGL